MKIHRLRTLGLCLAAPLLIIPSLRAVPPSNDNFASAITLTDNVAVNGTTEGATGPEAGEVGGGATVWYKYTAPLYGSCLFSIGTGTASNGMTIYVGDSLADLYEIDGGSSSISEIVGAGITYYIRVSPFFSAGSFSIIVHTNGANYQQSVFQSTSYQNDNFALATEVAGTNLKAIGYGQNASREAGELPDTGVGTLWWTWTAPSNGTTIFSSVGSNVFTTGVSVGTGTTLGDWKPIEAADNGSRQTIAGVTYHIAIGGGFNPGTYLLSIIHTEATPQGSFPGNGKGSARATIRGKFTEPQDITKIKVRVKGDARVTHVRFRSNGAFSFVSSQKSRRATYIVTAYKGSRAVATVSKTYRLR